DLPRFASSDERNAHLQRLRESLLAEWDDDGLLERYFREQDALAEPRPRLSLPWSATAQLFPQTDDVRVRLTAPRPLELKVADGVVEFACNKKRWRFAVGALVVLRQLAEVRASSVAELCAAARGELDEQTVRAFVGELMRHGLVAVVND
ncbi:MAG TPA: hypothetical protein VJT82_11505, partial [Pyrinomonadaceae bacterium]|nr:hypothetical protein [Pyrinomonadaceae bacterium]